MCPTRRRRSVSTPRSSGLRCDGPNRWVPTVLGLKSLPEARLSRVLIYPRTLMKDWEYRRPSIMFGCEDIEATYRELSRRGVKFTQVPKRMPSGTFAQFVDLDGNEFVLTEGT